MLLVSTAIAGALAPAGMALAQSKDANALPELVVTAEKRSSTVQATPISITAVTATAMQERGVTSIAQLTGEVPGLSIRSSGGAESEFTIRGLSSAGGVAPTVGFYLDETPVSPPTEASLGKVSIDPNLYDLARVEVLRGPQGTLYGASSMGGTIRLIPNAPDPTRYAASIEAIGSGTQGGGANGTLNAMINVPVVQDKVALRVIGTLDHESGWIDRVVLSDFPLPDVASTGSYFTAPRGDVVTAPVLIRHKDVNSEDMASIRAALVIRPTDRLTVTPSVFYQRLTQGGPDYYDANPGTLAHYQPYDIAEPLSDTFWVAAVKMNYDFGFASLVSATSYSYRNVRVTQDASELFQKSLGDQGVTAFDPAQGGAGPSSSAEYDPNSQFNQEIRLQSEGKGPFHWLVGGYYQNLRAAYVDSQLAPQAAPILGSTNIYTAHLPDRLEQAALFINLTYDLTSKLKVQFGGREFRAWDRSNGDSTGAFAPPTSQATKAKASGFNPMYNVSYTFDPDHMVYGTAAKGFRDGAAQQPVPASLCQADLASLGLTQSPTRYGPDTVWSYELGSKNRFFDRRVTLNFDGYYEHWSGVQQAVILPNCGYVYTANAGDAIVRGFEVEAREKLFDGLTLEQSLARSHAVFDRSNVNTGTIAGQELLNVPEWTASVSLRYERSITDTLSAYGRIDASYVGRSVADASVRFELPSYTLTNLRVGLKHDDWQASLFVDNLTDAHVLMNAPYSLVINVPGLDRYATNRPRTIGLDLSRSF
ncbi:TonB-dependent receptor [Phenylobacterium montanum]|uniref:TonB-dependent receptor n=1 Tax=Phenylobacterium montanum TaxID=2823693 RepID=A0A975IXW1_9CAUL|nr:TonB-dependent receptor [Caulobacter sp. S6]QUD89836.1 TonB-dependent receptor [Caulobacter sp. S6]